VTRLTDALEAMHGADDRWSSIQAEGIEWTDHQLRYAATTEEMRRRSGGQHSPSRGFSPVFGRYKPTETQRPTRAPMMWRAWIRSPTEYRAELDPGLLPPVTQIARDKTWWSWMQGQEVTSNLGDEKHGTGPLIHALNLLRPTVLLPHAEFQYVRRADVLGRAGFLLEGKRIPNQRRFGAIAYASLIGDRARLVVDEERGVVLRLESWHGDAPLHRITFKRITFDEPIDDALFDPPPGPAVDKFTRHADQRRHYWQLDKVAGDAPHPVFVPVGLEFRVDSFPGLWFHGVTAGIDKGDLEKGARPSVTLTYTISHEGKDGTLWIQESTSPFVYDSGEPWGVIGGIRIRQKGPLSQARLQIDGVNIHLECEIYSPEKLLEVARSLQRLPSEPPPLISVR